MTPSENQERKYAESRIDFYNSLTSVLSSTSFAVSLIAVMAATVVILGIVDGWDGTLDNALIREWVRR